MLTRKEKETNEPNRRFAKCKPKKHPSTRVLLPGSGKNQRTRVDRKGREGKTGTVGMGSLFPFISTVKSKEGKGLLLSAARFPSPVPVPVVVAPVVLVRPPSPFPGPPHHFPFRLQPWRRSRSTSTRTTSPARWRRSSTPPARRSLKNLPLSWCVRLFFARVFWLVWSSCERFGCFVVLVVVLFVFVICFVVFCLF